MDLSSIITIYLSEDDAVELYLTRTNRIIHIRIGGVGTDRWSDEEVFYPRYVMDCDVQIPNGMTAYHIDEAKCDITHTRRHVRVTLDKVPTPFWFAKKPYEYDYNNPHSDIDDDDNDEKDN